MNIFKTEQESFWAGEFGNNYISRNVGSDVLASNLSLFSRILSRLQCLNSCIEFGAIVGMNLKAIKLLFPTVEQFAIEINPIAAKELKTNLKDDNVFESSILDFLPTRQWDLVLIKGVLIHINPDCLSDVYSKLYQASSRYICICEYYNPTPVEVSYRGHSGRLFKRDFCGEMLDKYPDLKLVDYGFVYQRDPQFPLDDVTWFLLEK